MDNDQGYLTQVRDSLLHGIDGQPPETVGQPARTVGHVPDLERFSSPLKLGISPSEDFKASSAGDRKVKLPMGYEQMQDAMQIVLKDILNSHGRTMAKYGEIHLTVRQARLLPPNTTQGNWHLEPDRTSDSIEPDTQYLMSDADGTLLQTHSVKAIAPDRSQPERLSAAGTFNKMKTEILFDAGLARQAEPGEIVKLQNTVHAIAPRTSPERTMMRVTFVPPSAETLRNLPEEEKADLPDHIRQKLDPGLN